MSHFRIAGSAYLSLLMLMAVLCPVEAQEAGTQEVNQLLATGTKVSYAVGKWRSSGEFQVRLDNDYRSLNEWYVEGAVANLRFKHIEAIPDLRFSVKPNHVETRPGLGINLKATGEWWQVVLQHKYQLDIPSQGTTGQGVRQVLSLNALWREKFIPGLLGGWFYRWRGDFSDVEFVRAGGGLTYVLDPVHALNVAYFLGWENGGSHWTRSGFLLVQLTINVRSDWKYVPAKVFSF